MEWKETAASETEESSINIVFRINQTLFSISGRDVLSIQQLPPKLVNIPNAPNYVRGSCKIWGDLFSVIDLHSFFQWITVEQKYGEFTQMIDQRKQDHINWVEMLKHSKRTGEKFALAKDCHQCALGRWRDQYQTDAPTIQRLLRDLDVPHEELHALADDALADTEESERVLEKIELELMPRVLKILESM